MKTFQSTLLIVAAAWIATACTPRPVVPQFDTIALDTLVGNQEFGCQIEYRFATILNTADSPTLKEIEQTNIGYFFELEEFAGPASEAAQKSVEQLATEMGYTPTPPAHAGKNRNWGMGEISVESEGTVIDTVVSYIINRSSYTGGAHGMYTTECHTYSLAGGYELTPADLFSIEQLAKLDALIRTKLYQQYEVKDDKGLAEKGFFPEMIGVTENFYLSPTGITFSYNPYEIGCYALGNPEVEITLEELKEISQ